MLHNQNLIQEIREDIRGLMNEGLRRITNDGKQIIYTCMETLPGSMVANTIMNLSADSPILKKLEQLGACRNVLMDSDPEPALGNGGLGRLTACIGESAATLGVPLTISTLRYRSGLFRQELKDGRQIAHNDVWLDSDGNYFFEFAEEKDAKIVRLPDGDGCVDVTMTPCKIVQIGATGGCSVTAAWKVSEVVIPEGVNPEGIHPEMYCLIDNKLYCTDRAIRIRQEYVLSSVTVQTAISRCLAAGHSILDLPDYICIHINDTHTTWMIPELMHTLMYDHLRGRCKTWDEAWDVAWGIVTRVFAYTNHTVMPEALEEWPLDMIHELLPCRVYRMILEIDSRINESLRRDHPDLSWETRNSMRIISNGTVRMAHLAVFAAFSVNGVAKLHTEILKSSLLHSFYTIMPEKFTNVTNGVTQRKFMVYANPALRQWITNLLGSEDWISDMTQLKKLLPFADDRDVQASFVGLNTGAKRKLAAFVKRQRDIEIPEHFIFDVQVKRIHMYKRQLLNCLYIIYLYKKLKKDKSFDIVPTAFIFGGKAAEDYYEANEVIRLLLDLEKKIKEDPDMNGKLSVAYIENYNVAKAMDIFPAADISEQISTAGTEASGTSNMKFMLNGALTIGTMDGANVEIYEEVGDEGMFLFGARAEEVAPYRKYHDYNDFDEELRSTVDALVDGTLDSTYEALYNELRYGNYGQCGDYYLVLKDFRSYAEAHRRAYELYKDRLAWSRQCIRNIALAGRFSSDRMVREYCRNIWKIPCKAESE